MAWCECFMTDGPGGALLEPVLGELPSADVVTHPGMASGRGMSPRRTSCLHCLSAKRANTAISCVTVKSPLWLHYPGQSAPGPCLAKQDPSLCWPACSSMTLSGSRFLHHHRVSRGETGISGVWYIEEERRHGLRPVDACQANLRAACLLYYIVVRSNSLALIKMKSLLNLFTYFNCYHFFYFFILSYFFCSVLSSVIIKIIIIVTFRLSCFPPPPPWH